MSNQDLAKHNQELIRKSLPKARERCEECPRPVCIRDTLGCSSGSKILECFVLEGGVGPLNERQMAL